MNTALTVQDLTRALQRLGELVHYPEEVELLLVGGAAGMYTGALPASRTTIDCDVMHYLPEDALAAVELAAITVAVEQEIPKRWLNSDVQIRRDLLPEDWRARCTLVHASGCLRVVAIGRSDLIAMKVMAGRMQDLADIHDMRIRPDDISFVRSYLERLPTQGTPADQIASARTLLEGIEARGEDLHH